MFSTYQTLKFTLLLQLLISATSWAQEIRIYTDQVPKAQELADIMFPESSTGEVNGELTRSLKFIRKKDISEDPSVNTINSKSGDTVGMMIQFDFDSFTVKPESYPYLDEIGKLMNMENLTEKKIVIEGHTDAVGNEAYNLNLSANRAVAVKKYLMENHQIAPDRLQISGKGELELLPGIQPDDSKNRRVQFSPVE